MMPQRFALALVFVGAFTSLAAAQPAPVATDTTAAVTSYVAPPPPHIAPVDTQSIETPFTGTYALSGGTSGQLVSSRRDDDLVFKGTAAGVPFEAHASVADRAKSWKIPLGTASVGIVSIVGGHSNQVPPTTKVLVVEDGGKGDLKAHVEFQKKSTPVTVTRKKEALVIYGTYENGMKVYAQQCSAYYKAKGYTITEMPGDWTNVSAALAEAQVEGHAYQRVVVVSHGGWDGPMMKGDFIQISAGDSTGEEFGQFARAVRRGTTLDAKLMFSCCHSGGSNRFEDWRKDDHWTDDLARLSGRAAYGVDGSTSTEWSLNLAKFAEGEGPARQESRVSGPGGGKTVMPNQPAPLPIMNQPLG